MTAKVMVSSEGLSLLQNAAEESINDKKEKEKYKQSWSGSRSAVRATGFGGAKKPAQIFFPKLDFSKEVNAAAIDSLFQERMTKPTFFSRCNREKRYPQIIKLRSQKSKPKKEEDLGRNLFRVASEGQAYPISTLNFKSTIDSVDIRRLDNIGTPRSIQYKLRLQRLKKDGPTSPETNTDPKAILDQALVDLEKKAIECGESMSIQVKHRLNRFGRMKTEELSSNCASELKEIRKIGKLMTKHVTLESDFERNKDSVRKEYNNLVYTRADASDIITIIEKVGSEFTKLGNSLNQNLIPVVRLKFSKKSGSERNPIQNFKLKTESNLTHHSRANLKSLFSRTKLSIVTVSPITVNK